MSSVQTLPEPKPIHPIHSVVNHCLNNQGCREVSPVWDPLTAGIAAETPRTALRAEVERAPEPGAAVPEKGKVLLLEDDMSLREIITAYLTEQGYEVVPVGNGGEGVREVLASDFALVLCDLMMPALAGDVFYRAVERIRPDLCRRFIFMTGHRDAAQTNDFLRKVKGLVLEKPFLLDELRDAVILQEVCCAFESASEGAASNQDTPKIRPAAGDVHADGNTDPEATAMTQKIAAILARVRRNPVLCVPSPIPPSGEAELRGGSRGFRAAVLATLVLFAGIGPCAVLAWGLMTWHRDLQIRTEEMSATTDSMESDLTKISAYLEKTAPAHSKLEAISNSAKRAAEARDAQGWMPALACLTENLHAGIALRGIHARGIKGRAGACELRIEGTTAGTAPRKIADSFRQALQSGLETRMDGAVTVRIEKLDDFPDEPPASSGASRASFVITAIVGGNGS